MLLGKCTITHINLTWVKWRCVLYNWHIHEYPQTLKKQFVDSWKTTDKQANLQQVNGKNQKITNDFRYKNKIRLLDHQSYGRIQPLQTGKIPQYQRLPGGLNRSSDCPPFTLEKVPETLKAHKTANCRLNRIIAKSRNSGISNSKRFVFQKYLDEITGHYVNNATNSGTKIIQTFHYCSQVPRSYPK